MNKVHKKFKSSAALLLLLAIGAMHDSYTNTAEAIIFTISDGAIPVIFIQVGQGGSAINRVSFNVPAGNVGSGIPVNGDLNIVFYLYLRATAANPLTGFLTVDSATPLSNSNGDTMPTSEIRWTAVDGDIPSGVYAGITNQPLASFVSSLWVIDQHSFQYLNQNIFEAGTYNGQVTYTWAAP